MTAPSTREADEARRLAALHSFDILDSLPEREFDDLTQLTALICGTPMALVSLVDHQRSWFKARCGNEDPESPRTAAFCSHVITGRDLLVVPDAAADPRFAGNPQVADGTRWRFYAGIPIVTSDDLALGALCAVDTVPHQFSATQGEALRILGHQAATHLRTQKTLLEFRKLEALRDSLTHMIIHDLRQPLQSLLGGLDTLAAVGELDPVQSELLGIASTGGESLLGMINELLDINKLESGQLELDLQPLTPHALLCDAIAPLTRLITTRGITLSTEVQGGITNLYGDREKLRRTLMNLVGNALNSTPRGGAIQVTLDPGDENGSVRFSVRDTGEGIPPEAYGRIFEKFGQLEGRDGRTRRGTGLGLTFCKMVVEAHGGSIRVESQVGQGSTFSFHLPAPLREPSAG